MNGFGRRTDGHSGPRSTRLDLIPWAGSALPPLQYMEFASHTLERGGGARTRDENFLREGRGRLGRSVLRLERWESAQKGSKMIKKPLRL